MFGRVAGGSTTGEGHGSGDTLVAERSRNGDKSVAAPWFGLRRVRLKRNLLVTESDESLAPPRPAGGTPLKRASRDDLACEGVDTAHPGPRCDRRRGMPADLAAQRPGWPADPSPWSALPAPAVGGRAATWAVPASGSVVLGLGPAVRGGFREIRSHPEAWRVSRRGVSAAMGAGDACAPAIRSTARAVRSLAAVIRSGGSGQATSRRARRLMAGALRPLTRALLRGL